MQTITLMRHAKSSWANANQSDYDRPLNKRGNRDAPEMARRLVERKTIPTLILCSSAKRTIETAEHLLDVFGAPTPQIEYLKSLYLAPPEALLDALESAVESNHIMILAHNPGIEELSAHFRGVFDDTMPTCAIRQFSCASVSDLRKPLRSDPASDFTSAANNSIELIYSDYPKSVSV